MNIITDKFTYYDWKSINAPHNNYIFEKNEREIAITNKYNKIYISTPLNHSPFNFETSFKKNDFNGISTYIVNKLKYFE
jgi:hypothetical protein